MDLADPIDEVRRALRERCEAEAARARARRQRRSEQMAALRRGARQATDLAKIFAGILVGLAARVAILSMRGGRALGAAGVSFGRRAAQRSLALGTTAVRRYRVRSRARRDARRRNASSATSAPTDPVIDRERLLEALERRTLANREAMYGPDHVTVASIAHVIATRCAVRGDDDEARALYERTLRIFEKSLGPDHPDVAAVLTDMADLHAARGRVDEAASCRMRALEITGRRGAALGHRASGTEVVSIAR